MCLLFYGKNVTHFWATQYDPQVAAAALTITSSSMSIPSRK